MQTFIQHVMEELEQSPDIEDSPKHFFLSDRKGFIFGAGAQARVLLDCARWFHKDISGLIVSPEGRRNMESFYSTVPLLRTVELPDGLDRNTDVIIGIHEKHADEIRAVLENIGFTNVYSSQDWGTFNVNIRRFWWNSYLQSHDVTESKDQNGKSVLQCPFNDGTFKFCFSKESREVLANISPVLGDVVLPSIFSDYNYLIEGPYELGAVCLEKEDVVFDLGAHMGLFSAVAAAKGCNVLAFEPVPSALAYLRDIAALYSSIEVHPYAATDSKGVLSINVDMSNGNEGDGRNLGNSSLLPQPSFEGINVQGITLDEFVEERGLERVDFIKADIEGAERAMLRGAKRTLARFAPKLALCTYHKPGDPEEMERLILEANPRYQITHKWSKLYAHCTS